MKLPHHDVIVIGTSAGGMVVLCELLEQLPADLPASIFIVQHLARNSNSEVLVDRLNKTSKLTCQVATHEQIIEHGNVYFVPQDHHLLLQKGRMLVTKGPRENLFRPAIDPLFRSAAAAYGPRVIGIVLTGMLQDGTVGMEMIKRSGGITMVQRPEEAEYPDMPLSVLNEIEVDYVASVSEMGQLLQELVFVPAASTDQVPEDVIYEASIAERLMLDSGEIEDTELMGPRSQFSCPSCGGALWEVNKGNVTHFRCHVGHAFTPDAYLNANVESIEETLWIAMRMLEERRTMLNAMADQDKRKGHNTWSETQEERAQELKQHIARIRHLLMTNANARHRQEGQDEKEVG
ncbi:chemotaxis protein CheB [Rufibacter sediminis]|uniref:protein-glutamate methylesterase n=1 Tax=Rufibacter sediminis TaxID=2762756 RepID=A0ABR6VV05_9BACT|nr:chemotaxis protein CheB [Rufibacter sediminis]MBC3541036.1 chemotaxis protein CheB [Rufibacter sediminis]